MEHNPETEKYLAALGEEIREQRELLGWARDTLAITSETSVSSLVRVESGNNTTVAFLFAVADALDLYPSDLLAEVERRLGY